MTTQESKQTPRSVKLPVAGRVSDFLDRIAESFIATYGDDAVSYAEYVLATIKARKSAGV